MQIYSVYMHIKHAVHQLEPKPRRGFQSKQQQAAEVTRAERQACASKQLTQLCAHVTAMWSAAPDRELLQMGLPALR